MLPGAIWNALNFTSGGTPGAVNREQRDSGDPLWCTATQDSSLNLYTDARSRTTSRIAPTSGPALST